MCRRSKSPFAILVHSLPLVIEVKRKASCFAFEFDQFLFVCNDEGKSRYALDAFVCTADDKVDSHSPTGISTPPKLLIASTIIVRPFSLTTFATDSISFRIPEVVSLWTMDTCVMAGSFFRISFTLPASGTLSYFSW